MKIQVKHVMLIALVAVLVTAWGVTPAIGMGCPVQIKLAEEAIQKAEAAAAKAPAASKADVDQLIQEAKKWAAEGKKDHTDAKAKKNHADSIRKSKIAIAYAEEAALLSQ